MRAWEPPLLPSSWHSSEHPPFVAREAELDAILAVWPDVVRGSVHSVFVTGEPGIGKTRLIAEAATRLSERGAAVFAGSCVAEFGAPFEPLDVPLRRLLELVRGATAADSSSRLIRRAIAPDKPSPAAQEADLADQLRLAAAIVDLLRQAAQSHSIVLVLDDLHWADETALRLLPRLIVGVEDSPVLVLGGVRSTHPDRSVTVDRVLANLSSFEGVRKISLRAMSADDVLAYVRTRLVAPEGEMHEVAMRLSFLTGGNPFLLREAWRYAGEITDPGVTAITLPESINDLLYARLHSIDAEQRRLLESAAILGMDVVPDELSAVSGEPPDIVLDALDRALAAGLLEVPHGPGEDLRFPHAIARQAILDGVPARERPALHARAAAMLEQRMPTPARVTQRLAYHYAHAITLGFREQAIANTAAAAELAASRIAYEEAARLFERAADLCELPTRRDELLLSAAQHWRLAADFARARSLAERVCESGAPNDRLRGAIEYEEAAWRPGLPGARAAELLTRALDFAPEAGSRAERIEARAALARAMSLSGRPGDALALAAEATEQARATGDEELLLRVMRRGYLHSFRPQILQEAYERAGEIWTTGGERASTSGGLAEWLYAAPFYGAAAAYLLGDPAGLDDAESALTTAAAHEGSYWHYWRDCVAYGRHFVAGRLDEARSAYRRAAKTEAGFRSDASSSVAAQQLYMIKRELGQLGHVREIITGTESPQQHWGPGLLGLYTEFEMTRPAARMLAWILDRDTPVAHESAEWPAVLALLSEAVVHLGDRDAAARLRPLITEYSGLNLMSGYFVSCFGSADRYLGQVDALLDVGDPGASFDAALALEGGVGAALHASHTRTARARWLVSRDARSKEARLLAERVRAEATAAGWARVLRVVDHDARLRGRADRLTPREIEILVLIDEGLTNREIAERLFLSEHTVANHMRSILTKTASSNRAHAVRYARDVGLL
ncbi:MULTISPECIES: AAA family ATPase [unclassified Microbacterium]|uniref:helix-turn-helix transcriptional regulator n=1 Tax=unclassified Microbacterium TaxID=2609290 RepID=UPI00214ADB69|nr:MULTISPECIES: AAA family ATPase [unclassified Microbacterium]MCR2784179.1 AAA family ATPase [Microbacterium sp. zg.B96]WIM14987.1 AAA family ATPase [Microbacterium sp. zg-B96]